MNLSKTYAVTIKETRHILRDRITFLMLLLIPVFLMIAFSYSLAVDVKEVPITFEERLHGASKLTSSVILDYLLQIVRLYGGRASGLYKQREPSSRVEPVGSSNDP